MFEKILGPTLCNYVSIPSVLYNCQYQIFVLELNKKYWEIGGNQQTNKF